VKCERYKKFSCGTKNCKINSKSWRSCKWCRFKKCIDGGLKPNWVLDKKERKRKREKKKKPIAATDAKKNQEHLNAMVLLLSPAKMGNQVSFGRNFRCFLYLSDMYLSS
jgi:hypothetical protein